MNQLSLQEFCKNIYFHVINIVWFFLHETNSRGHKCKSIASKTYTNRQYLKRICVYIKIWCSSDLMKSTKVSIPHKTTILQYVQLYTTVITM